MKNKQKEIQHLQNEMSQMERDVKVVLQYNNILLQGGTCVEIGVGSKDPKSKTVI
jgi:hypothetical protein